MLGIAQFKGKLVRVLKVGAKELNQLSDVPSASSICCRVWKATFKFECEGGEDAEVEKSETRIVSQR